ncbi:uncharacterized protein N7459_006627 [Penicillium hispanicum]|uniref:uncharacterized protein n=1 Tax=Penicillium hispanicum TaxID=1080232 RepID=UPI00254135C8|nr:uncharacterized protein N7459_006627 [Penicillium hispanicum]KAJ5577663.1 hypothetical protein N7459_006627 [Penicillium hispanicum]
MDEPSKAEVLKGLHNDLALKYRKHAASVEDIWNSFDSKQRANCLRAGAMDGVVLKHRLDRSMGNSVGVNGTAGDLSLIQEMVLKRGLQHAQPFKDCYTMLIPGQQYGMSFQITAHKDQVLAPLQPSIQAGLCVPQALGELVLDRQVYLLQGLSILIDDILDQGSKTRDRKEKPKRPDTVAATALSKLTIQNPPRPKRTARGQSKFAALPDLIASAHDQQESQQEYLSLLSTEPSVLAHAVNAWFFSRPQLVPDEKGRRMPVHTDKYISASTFEAIHSSIKDAAIWSYLTRLLETLNNPSDDKTYRTLILQEISNICQLELSRAQALFKRYVQLGAGSKWFKRTSNAHEITGNPRVALKGNLEALARMHPCLYYMLRLCQPKLSVSDAIKWIHELSKILEVETEERENLTSTEAESLGELAVVAVFIRELSSGIPLPPFSKAKEQMFVSRWEQLEIELNGLRDQIDLRDFVVPIDNLLEPGIAQSALRTLDQFTIEKTGTKMGFLYQDLIEDCLSGLRDQCAKVKANAEQEMKMQIPAPAPETAETVEARVQQRRKKAKTRPSHSSIYDIVEPAEPGAAEEPATPPQIHAVPPSIAVVFEKVFNKSQTRSSVSWVAFETAMGALGFTVLPKYGSVYTFYPPDTMAMKRPFTVHRPHKAMIEGYRLLILARRLKRVYGWSAETFVVN